MLGSKENILLRDPDYSRKEERRGNKSENKNGMQLKKEHVLMVNRGKNDAKDI